MRAFDRLLKLFLRAHTCNQIHTYPYVTNNIMTGLLMCIYLYSQIHYSFILNSLYRLRGDYLNVCILKTVLHSSYKLRSVVHIKDTTISFHFFLFNFNFKISEDIWNPYKRRTIGGESISVPLIDII